MTDIRVVEVREIRTRPPRAVQIPATLTAADIDDVLYPFGFEWFGTNHGVQRLLALDDDNIGDYLNNDDLTRFRLLGGTPLILYDRGVRAWSSMQTGDWIVQPNDGHGGFVLMHDDQFRVLYDIVGEEPS